MKQRKKEGRSSFPEKAILREFITITVIRSKVLSHRSLKCYWLCHATSKLFSLNTWFKSIVDLAIVSTQQAW